MDKTTGAKSFSAKPFEFKARTIVMIPAALVKNLDIKEGLTEFEITPTEDGLLFKIVRKAGGLTT